LQYTPHAGSGSPKRGESGSSKDPPKLSPRAQAVADRLAREEQEEEEQLRRGREARREAAGGGGGISQEGPHMVGGSSEPIDYGVQALLQGLFRFEPSESVTPSATSEVTVPGGGTPQNILQQSPARGSQTRAAHSQRAEPPEPHHDPRLYLPTGYDDASDFTQTEDEM
jgi:hypothetical protein